MTEHQRENLSACLDGELSADQLRFMLRRLEHDASLRELWARYQLIGDSLRLQLPHRLADEGFSTRVMRAIEAEAASTPSLAEQVTAVAPPRRRWLQWSAGSAIAASVAVAALMLSQPAGQGALNANAPAAPSGAGASLANASGTATTEPAVSEIGSPAVVPPWLSNSSASSLSQRASATLGANPDGSIGFTSAHSLAPYQLHHYKAVRGSDGSYLLLIDPAESSDAGAPAARAASH